MPNDNDEYMLSTLDNPYNPFTDFDSWYQYDVTHGYNTCSYLARVVHSSDELSEKDQMLAMQLGMDEIIELNISGNYIKVNKDYVPRNITIDIEI